MKAISYPNYTDYIQPRPMRDLSKWMNTMRDIYLKTRLGMDRNAIIDSLTNSWDRMEKLAFLDWMKYYESGDFNKYKKAQYYVNDAINYFVPNPANKPPSPILNMDKFPAEQQILPQQPAPVSPEEQKKAAEAERRKVVEDQRRKILGRLNSAEKLLSSHQGQIFAGPDFERLLNAIYELKKQIQTVNKISLSTQTCIDLIIRQANILNRDGFSEAAKFMVKLAQQTPGNFDFNFGETPAGGSIPQGQGSLGNNAPSMDNLTAIPPTAVDMPSPADGNDSGIDEFLENMEGGGFTKFDDNKIEDNVDIGDDDVILDQEILPDDIVISNEVRGLRPVEAQVMPAAPKPIQQKSAPTHEQKSVLPTIDKVKKAPEVVQIKNDFDALIDSAFNNLTVNDVVNKLDAINDIFRNREVSRQLAIADVMLDRLGIASYFPELAEATNKNLEAGQYCLTRLENILSRLRGATKLNQIDFEGQHNTKQTPEVAALKTNLENQKNKEQERKQMRKQIDDEKNLEKAVKPEGNVENVSQELATAPVRVEEPKPATKLPTVPVV